MNLRSFSRRDGCERGGERLDGLGRLVAGDGVPAHGPPGREMRQVLGDLHDARIVRARLSLGGAGEHLASDEDRATRRDAHPRIGERRRHHLLARHPRAAQRVADELGQDALALVGALRSMSWPYYAGLALAGAMMLYHWTLIRERSRKGCFKAFRHNNWVGAAIFAGIAASLSLA